MKISNSKKQLAKIISENGGWRDGYGFSAQDGDACAVWFYDNAPVRSRGAWWVTSGSGLEHCGIEDAAKLPNWHQTILSRDEYLRLYPVAETAPEPVVETKPTIEHLASDYRNAKDYADRKQQEADAAKAGAEAKLAELAELVAAGKVLGLGLSVAGHEPELMITDWRDLQIGDEVEYISGTLGGFSGEPGVVSSIDRSPDCGIYRIRVALQNGRFWCDEWRFISRPAKGDTNA